MSLVDFLILDVATIVFSAFAFALVVASFKVDYWVPAVVLPALALALVMRLTSLDLSTAAGESSDKI